MDTRTEQHKRTATLTKPRRDELQMQKDTKQASGPRWRVMDECDRSRDEAKGKGKSMEIPGKMRDWMRVCGICCSTSLPGGAREDPVMVLELEAEASCQVGRSHLKGKIPGLALFHRSEEVFSPYRRRRKKLGVWQNFSWSFVPIRLKCCLFYSCSNPHLGNAKMSWG